MSKARPRGRVSYQPVRPSDGTVPVHRWWREGNSPSLAPAASLPSSANPHAGQRLAGILVFHRSNDGDRRASDMHEIGPSRSSISWRCTSPERVWSGEHRAASGRGPSATQFPVLQSAARPPARVQCPSGGRLCHPPSPHSHGLGKSVDGDFSEIARLCNPKSAFCFSTALSQGFGSSSRSWQLRFPATRILTPAHRRPWHRRPGRSTGYRPSPAAPRVLPLRRQAPARDVLLKTIENSSSFERRGFLEARPETVGHRHDDRNPSAEREIPSPPS